MGNREIRHITLSGSLILFGLVNFGNSLWCQTFSKHYEFPTENAGNQFTSIVELDGQFIVDGVGNTGQYQSYGIFSFDFDGESISQINFGLPSLFQFSGYFGSSDVLNSTYCTVYLSDTISENSFRTLNLVTVNENLDVINSHSQVLELYTTWNAVCVAEDNRIALVGNQVDEQGNVGSFLKVFDYSLEPLLESTFPSEEDFFGNPIWLNSTYVKSASDGGFIIGSQRLYSDEFSECTNEDYKSNPLIIKLSGSGEELWRFETGDCYSTEPPPILETSNGDILFGTSIVNPDISTEFQNWRKHRIVKLDSSGDLLWEKDFDDETILSIPLEIIEHSNGEYLVLGTQWGPTLGQRNATIFSISEEGDMNWHRTYRYAIETNCLLFDMIESSDEGIVACGWTFPDETFESLDGWLLKLYSNGCLTEDCSEYNKIDETERQEIQLSIGPNPSNGTVYIELSSHNSFGSELEIVVHNLQGVLVDNILNVSSNETIIYEASHLPAGCYIVSLMNGQDKIQTKKLVLEE